MKDYCLFVPYVNRPDLLLRAVNSVRELGPEVIDNSDGWQAPPDCNVGTVKMPVPLSFSQTMNWGLYFAEYSKAKYMLFLHSDAEAGPEVGEALLNQCRAQTEPWGAIFTAYDAFVALNVAAFKAIGGWDTNLPW